MNLGNVIKQEIRRIARRELKPVVLELRGALKRQRAEIAALKQQIAQNKRTQRRATMAAPPQDLPEDARFRFSAARLGALREKKGLTQAELAQLLQTSVPTLIKWLQGKGRPAPIQLARIAWVRAQGKRALRQALAETTQ
jgi:DNA-binding transcriptional regulator YiaG